MVGSRPKKIDEEGGLRMIGIESELVGEVDGGGEGERVKENAFSLKITCLEM